MSSCFRQDLFNFLHFSCGFLVGCAQTADLFSSSKDPLPPSPPHRRCEGCPPACSCCVGRSAGSRARRWSCWQSSCGPTPSAPSHISAPTCAAPPFSCPVVEGRGECCAAEPTLVRSPSRRGFRLPGQSRQNGPRAGSKPPRRTERPPQMPLPRQIKQRHRSQQGTVVFGQHSSSKL